MGSARGLSSGAASSSGGSERAGSPGPAGPGANPDANPNHCRAAARDHHAALRVGRSGGRSGAGANGWGRSDDRFRVRVEADSDHDGDGLGEPGAFQGMPSAWWPASTSFAACVFVLPLNRSSKLVLRHGVPSVPGRI